MSVNPIKAIRDEWPNIKKAPWTIVSTVLLLSIFSTVGVYSIFRENSSRQADLIKTLSEQVDRVREELESRKEDSHTTSTPGQVSPAMHQIPSTADSTQTEESESTTRNIPVPKKPAKSSIHIEQHNEGAEGTNIAAYTIGGITINPPKNPSAAVITYDFNGVRRVATPGRMIATAAEETEAFTEMCQLEKRKNWAELLGLCEKWIDSTPEWLTPYAFAGAAKAHLGEISDAIELLEYVDQRTTGNTDYDRTRALLKELEQFRASQLDAATQN